VILWYNVSSPENGQEGLEMIGSDGIRAEEIFEEGEEEGG
jgi:hypothetical protein